MRAFLDEQIRLCDEDWENFLSALISVSVAKLKCFGAKVPRGRVFVCS